MAPTARVGLAAVLAGALLLGACSGDEPAGEAPSDPVTSSPTSVGDDAPDDATDVAQDGTPTIEHVFGTTDVPAAPERVVTVGFNDQDFVLALGTTPVGTREYLSYDYPSRPWAQDLLPDEPIPTVGGQELDLEAVAALDPDLIVGVYSFVDEAVYLNLSRIAPTVMQSGEFEVGGMPWQDQLLLTGRALGATDEAAALVADVEQQFADAAAAHPAFDGRTLAVGFWFDGEFFVLEEQDLRSRFFQDLGFEVPEVTGEISNEQWDPALDQDVLVVLGTTPDTLADDELFQSLDVVADGRVVYLGEFSDDFGGALGFGSPLSLPFALEVAVPRLADATDDDPATVPAPYPTG